MEERKKAFIIYASALKAMEYLNDAEFRECVLKMADYSMNGVEESGSTAMVDMVLRMAYPNLDASRKRHEAAIENGMKGAAYGKRGGRPRKNESKEEYNERKARENVSNND